MFLARFSCPDVWLSEGNPFELRRTEYAKEVKFGGYVTVHQDENGRNVFAQEGYQSVTAIPYDMPIVGYGNVRYLYLKSILNLLFKHTVSVTDSTSVRSISQSGKGIQKTCGKPSQTAVTQCGIRLFIFDHINIKPQFFQYFLHSGICLKVDHIVTQSTPVRNIMNQTEKAYLYNLSIEWGREVEIFHILISFNPLYLRKIIV